MHKTFFLDTNVLLHDPACFDKFEDNDLVVVLPVIEELDRFKKHTGELGYNARKVIRRLDALREKGNLADGVQISEGSGTLYVVDIDIRDVDAKVDNEIIKSVIRFKQTNTSPVVLITKDVNVRIKSDALRIPSENYNDDLVDVGDYTGTQEVLVDGEIVDKVWDSGVHNMPEVVAMPNEFVCFKNRENPKRAVYTRNLGQGLFKKVNYKPVAANLTHRNMEQILALDALLEDSVKLVTLQGMSGSGKTLLAIAAGLQKVLVEGVYDNIVISRPVIPMGPDMGALPGDIDDKMNPWLKPLFDAIDVVRYYDARSGRSVIPHSFNNHSPVIEVAPLAYIRGRSIANSFVIVDEVQNTSPGEIKTIITRIGQNSKLVLTGDTTQIDVAYLDKFSNGLSHTIHCLKDSSLSAHILLKHSERSELAELAAERL